MKKRVKKVIRNAAILLGAGLAYAAFVNLTGLAIPCVFHLVTGWKCPGCGVTRVTLALLRLDFREAWVQNRCLVLISPILAFFIVTQLVSYIRTGRYRIGRVQTIVNYVLIGVLVVFGVVRNIFGW